MTMMFPQFFKCAVCGSEHKFLELASTNQFGAPDLDFRPPEMARSTIGEWVHECPTCGYVAPSISDDPGKVTREYLQSAEYRGCDGLQFASELAARFYRFSKNCLLNGELSDAYEGLIYAAWASTMLVMTKMQYTVEWRPSTCMTRLFQLRFGMKKRRTCWCKRRICCAAAGSLSV